MAVSFARTFAALHADRGRGSLVALGVAGALLAAWIAWGALAEIAIERVSVHARIEAMPGPTRVAALAAGRVAEVHLAVGTRVAAGAVLATIDATPEQIAADQARARVAELAPELASLDRELAAEDDAGRDGAAAERAAEHELAARQRAAAADLGFAELDLAREELLASRGATAGALRDKAVSTVAERRAAVDAIAHEADALAASHREHGDGRRSHREQLARAHAELTTALVAARAEVDRLAHELARRTIRAPIAGTLGEVATVQPGAMLQAGDVVATIVPDGALQIVADYDAAVLGRLAVGQPARLRLDGFPWTRYGTIAARVRRVASEPRDGMIRVELALDDPPPALPVHHGMTGAVEIETERLSPAALMLRMIGEGLAP